MLLKYLTQYQLNWNRPAFFTWEKRSDKKQKLSINIFYYEKQILKIRSPIFNNVPLLYPLKTSENRRFSDVFRGYRSRTLVESGLMLIPIFGKVRNFYEVTPNKSKFHNLCFCIHENLRFTLCRLIYIFLGEKGPGSKIVYFQNKSNFPHPFKSRIIYLHWKTNKWPRILRYRKIHAVYG